MGRRVGEPGLTSMAVEGLARLAAAGGELAEAAGLLADATELRERYVRPRSPHEQQALAPSERDLKPPQPRDRSSRLTPGAAFMFNRSDDDNQLGWLVGAAPAVCRSGLGDDHTRWGAGSVPVESRQGRRIGRATRTAREAHGGDIARLGNLNVVPLSDGERNPSRFMPTD
jgi:hypothetical protein